MFSLTGKTAVVTGARRGIGLAMAMALAEAGADICAVSAQMEPHGSEVQRGVEALGRRCTTHRVDVSDRDAVRSLCRTLLSDGPVPDILVNNAATILRAPAAEHPDEFWDVVVETNLSAPFILSREIGRAMLQRGSGKIIFTASLLSVQGGINVPGYTAAKSGILGLTKALANEWAGSGVNVNAVIPGYVVTDNTAALRGDSERSQSISARIPAGRWGTPADFAGVTVFLASSASDYVHGAALPVDGGWLGR